jgi:hypothetical protein
MNRILAVVPCALLLLAGCGDACTSTPVAVSDVTNGCSSLAAGQPTIAVQLCPSCTDTTPSCNGDVQGNQIHLDSVAQQCQANQGCNITGCSVSPVQCPLNASLAPGQYQVLYTTAGGGTQATSVTVVASGGSSSCTL